MTLLLLLAASGKSAQIPLWVWLPDAMEGPTPVSALIHAATMVTAGVYMIVRLSPFFELAGNTLPVVAWIGALTALMGATIALTKTDLKRILAYSTISQLGFMFLAVGVGGYVAGMFQLTTHAFFKACLFLGAGSVMHALHGELDINKMGGLKDKLPSTYRTFLIAAAALAGFPLLAGFFSKDAILVEAFNEGHYALYAIGLFTALLTAVYSFKMVFVPFWGEPRDKKLHDHAHEFASAHDVAAVDSGHSVPVRRPDQSALCGSVGSLAGADRGFGAGGCAGTSFDGFGDCVAGGVGAGGDCWHLFGLPHVRPPVRLERSLA